MGIPPVLLLYTDISCRLPKGGHFGSHSVDVGFVRAGRGVSESSLVMCGQASTKEELPRLIRLSARRLKDLPPCLFDSCPTFFPLAAQFKSSLVLDTTQLLPQVSHPRTSTRSKRKNRKRFLPRYTQIVRPLRRSSCTSEPRTAHFPVRQKTLLLSLMVLTLIFCGLRCARDYHFQYASQCRGRGAHQQVQDPASSGLSVLPANPRLRAREPHSHLSQLGVS